MGNVKGLLLALLLLPLAGCASQGQSGEELALEIRGGYLASGLITTSCTVTADYGERVYDFSFDTVTTQESTTLTLTAPQELGGLVVEVMCKDSALSYQGVLVETGALSEGGLTPVTAVPALLEGLQTGYIQSCLEGEGVLTLTCGDPDTPVGTGEELVLTLDSQTGNLLQGEIFADGTRVIDCTFDTISWSGLPQGEG